MNTSVCFYFQVHQPFRLRSDYHFFNIGPDHNYEDYHANRAIMQRIAKDCYLPANAIMLDLIKKYKGKFKVSYSISGLALEQFELYAPEVIESFQKLVQTGHVELLSETYYHSLAFLKSREEFKEQVELHRAKIFELFGVTPTAFRNTELIYHNDLATEVKKMGYQIMLAEGADQVLHWRSPNFVYSAAGSYMKLLLKNYRLSDDIAFRFGNADWKDYPLTPPKFAKWISQIVGNGDVVNLFMDYETFGEHQKDPKIFDFLKKLPASILAIPNVDFKTPTEIANTCEAVANLDVPFYTSWADESRDLSAWLGNPLQDSAFDMAYSLETDVKKTQDQTLIHTWRKLLASDHSYYKCTKWSNDGDVHRYFSPFKSPHDAYIVYTNVLNDLKLTVKNRQQMMQ